MAPVTGMVIPLEQVPDQAFAQKMLGDGVAVRPGKKENWWLPVTEKITYVPDTAHAIALTEEHGLEILLHVGVNTVEQQGKGFLALVKTGDMVKMGQPLLAFDQECLEKAGCDLATPMVITNGNKVGKNGKRCHPVRCRPGMIRC